jgi:hypothetical protein
VPVTPLDPVIEPQHHVVNLYETDDDVVTDAIRFLGAGLRAGEVTIAVATPMHRHAFEVGLVERGIDVAAAVAAGQYLALDAAATLATFLRADGTLDHDAFAASIGNSIADAVTDGVPVRCFGEMVTLLWEAGNVTGAIELESMWNALSREHRFSLYCAYPMASLVDKGNLGTIRQVCEQHSNLIGPKSYDSVPARSRIEIRAAEWTQMFLPLTSAVRAVRQVVTDALLTWGDDALVHDASIVASELAANAVVHANGPFRLSVSRSEATIRIAVEDESPVLPHHLAHETEGFGGRGVALVAGICTGWGTDVRPGGKVVWAELARTSPA